MITHRARRDGVPWTIGELLVLVTCSMIGASLILAAWYQTSRTESLPSQVAWVNVAVVGLVFSGGGSATWLLAGRRAVGVRRNGLSLPDASSNSPDPQPTRAGRVIVRGTASVTRHHRPDCLLVRGKAVEPIRSGTYEPCGVCRP